MSYAADDSASIAQRLKEIEADRQLALTGSSAPVTGQESKVGEYALGYTSPGLAQSGFVPPWPYTAAED